jgi:EmrB/QacA subfamily drug resistance transporter
MAPLDLQRGHWIRRERRTISQEISSVVGPGSAPGRNASHHREPHEEETRRPKASARSRSRAVALVVAGALFMEMLDATVISTALPKIAASLHVSAVGAGLGVTLYLVTAATLTPLSGWLADRVGVRRVFCTAISVFVVASVFCAASQEFWQFAAARVLQGAAGAMMVPVGRVAVLRDTAKADLLAATASITWPGLIAPVLGPSIGGLVSTYSSWRAIFLLNVPIGLVALPVALAVLPNIRRESTRFDVVGFGAGALALATLVTGMALAGTASLNWFLIGGLIGFGFLMGTFAVWYALRHPTPIADLTPMRIATYAVTSLEGSLLRIAINMVPFLLPLLFELGFGYSAVTSGLLVLAVFAGNLAMKAVTTPIVRYLGFRRILVGNGLLVAASLAGCALFEHATPFAVIVVTCFLSGACRSLEFTGLNTLAFADVPADLMSTASALNATITQLTVGLGVAIAATTLHLLAGGATPTVPDFRSVFALGALIAAVGSLLFLRLDRVAGAELSEPSRSLRTVGLLDSQSGQRVQVAGEAQAVLPGISGGGRQAGDRGIPADRRGGTTARCLRGDPGKLGPPVPARPRRRAAHAVRAVRHGVCAAARARTGNRDLRMDVEFLKKRHTSRRIVDNR